MDFYSGVLSFEVLLDEDMGEGARWLEVRPPGAQTSIVLSSAESFGKRPGEGAFLTFAADDAVATVEQLRARGAVTSEVVTQLWGTYATVSAPGGH